MNFSNAIREENRTTFTENGHKAYNTTANACLDLFAVCGALRKADPDRISTLFEAAYAENPLLATKIIFYTRDIRGGVGERDTFRSLLRTLVRNHPDTAKKNLKYVSEFGRWDDLYSLIGTSCENDMWTMVKAQLESDLENMSHNKPVSLLAKWLKTADASSEKTRKLGIYTAKKLGYDTAYWYKRHLRALRKYIDIVEAKMSTNRWDEINYETTPSNAMSKHLNAFITHDEDRYNKYIENVSKGTAKINTTTLYPYDVLEQALRGKNSDAVQTLWDNLPNYVEPGSNVLIMADTSGSMSGRPMNIAVSLAIYFAERNIGPYHNLWMSFSYNPKFHELKGNTLYQKIKNLDKSDWEMNTDLNKALRKILDVAVKNHVSNNEMPKSLVIISDMEIDCAMHNKFLYDEITEDFNREGYTVPNIIFWNVESRHNTYLVNSSTNGVQLVSGASASIFKQLMNMIDKTPIECMEMFLNNPRYDCITV